MNIKESYFKSAVMFKRLHLLFTEVIRHELMRMNIHDINSTQCMIIYNIGHEKISVGDITNRRYYIGSNVSYNLRKMVEHKYVTQEKNPNDLRSSKIMLSDKGIELHDKLDKLFESQAKTIFHADAIEAAELLGSILINIEIFWLNLLKKDK